MKVNKQIKGEIFRYRVTIIPNTMTVEVRWWSVDEPVIGKVSDDFKYILLPESFKQSTFKGLISVKRLKLQKYQQIEIRELNLKL